MSKLWPQRILLPLDGSALDISKLDKTTLDPATLESSEVANQAISIAARIARNTGAKVDLLEVMYIPLTAGTDQGSFAFEQEENVKENEIKYVTSFLKKNGVKPHRVPDSEDILGSAKTYGDDLIVLYGHRFTGYDALLSEKEAQEIEEGSPKAVLLLHGEKLTQPLRALFTLDPKDRVTLDPKDSSNSSPLVDTFLEPAMQLVAALSAPVQGTLKLFEVVDEDQARGEKNRLEVLADNLNSRAEVVPPLQINSSVVTSSDVPKAIIEAAQSGEGTDMSGGFNLIAMATHGRGGLQHIFHHSVTKPVLKWMMQDKEMHDKDKQLRLIFIVHHP